MALFFAFPERPAGIPENKRQE